MSQDSRIDRIHADDFLDVAIGQANREAAMSDVGDCTCHLYCGDDSHSGKEWHTHEGDPCPLHPNAPVVG